MGQGAASVVLPARPPRLCFLPILSPWAPLPNPRHPRSAACVICPSASPTPQPQHSLSEGPRDQSPHVLAGIAKQEHSLSTKGSNWVNGSLGWGCFWTVKPMQGRVEPSEKDRLLTLPKAGSSGQLSTQARCSGSVPLEIRRVFT